MRYLEIVNMEERFYCLGRPGVKISVGRKGKGGEYLSRDKGT